ncbi:unnamed protein product [Effrenium voratum]|uniref:Vps16 C-terminal domain-containing protein n=1 Tax=Effrenium voratum TaxID=2562239 RepID=A0AA36MG06_9DINO|nr:unnamed protein product [Effrenium voratum]
MCGCTIIFTSPQQKNYDSVWKQAEGRSERYFMPVWSEEEVLNHWKAGGILQVCKQEADVKMAYAMIGGSVRYLGKLLVAVAKKKTTLEEEAKQMIRDCVVKCTFEDLCQAADSGGADIDAQNNRSKMSRVLHIHSDAKFQTPNVKLIESKVCKSKKVELVCTALKKKGKKASAEVKMCIPTLQKMLKKLGEGKNITLWLLQVTKVHSAVNAACSGDVCQRGADLQSCARLIKEKPQELQVASDLVTGALLRAGNFERARMFNELLDRKRPAAFAALSRVFVQTSYEERLKLLRFSKDLFALTEGPEAEKASMQFMSQACADELELLSAQAGLEEKASAKNWGRGREVRFLGLPLVTSLLKLIELEEVKEADELRAKMRMVDKRYWRIKIRGLASCGNFDELNAFAILASPIGYEPFVEAFLKAGRNDFALALVPKVKSGEQQALYYQQMNLHEEAQRARQGQDRGAGRLLNFFAGR